MVEDFEIHGDQNEIRITSGNAEYRLSLLKGRALLEIVTEYDDPGNRSLLYAPPPETVLKLRAQVGAYTVIRYTEAPMTYGEGTWIH